MARGIPVRSAEGARRIVCALTLLGAVALSGCATMIRGTTQPVTVVTDPPGAKCTLKAGDSDGPWSVAETPGVVEVKRGRAPLEVTCTKPGHFDAVERIEASSANRSSADTPEQGVLLAGSGAALAIPWGAPQLALFAAASPAAVPLFIGLLLAAPVTIAVDYGSGAMFAYPPVIAVLIVPSEFPDEGARNEYFADLERRFDEALQKRRKANDDYCRAAATFELVKWKCERLRKQEEAFRTERRQWLAENRAKTSIKAVPTTSP